jgi:hypothetical protein
MPYHFLILAKVFCSQRGHQDGLFESVIRTELSNEEALLNG